MNDEYPNPKWEMTALGSFMLPDEHSESYVDSEGEERCVTCDKWLEPGYYTIEDHQRAMR